MYLDAAGADADTQTIRLTVIATVLASIVAHGISAMPGIGWYKRALAKLPATAAEHQAAAQVATCGRVD